MEASAPKSKRVVIAGGGFGGLYAALHLDRTIGREPGVEISIIDPQNFALFTPMLHEVASGALDPSSIVAPIRQVLRHARYVGAEVTNIDLAARTVTISYGLEPKTRVIAFDQLLIAAGSKTRFPSGFRQHSFGMKTIDDSLVLRNWPTAPKGAVAGSRR